MSREQANSFKKHRDAEDPQGNLAWAARLGHKALRAGPEALARIDVEREFELDDSERVLWRLVRLPRKYLDLEHSGVLPTDKLRAFFRGLVAADVVDILDVAEAKALLPAEIKRLKAEVAGKELARPTQLKAKVYRPDIEAGAAAAAAAPAPAPLPRTATPAPARPAAPARAVPAAVELDGEQKMLLDEIERAFAAMPKQNHFEFMGLARGTDDGSVRQAYMRLAREYHPDRVASSFPASVREKVDALFKRLGEAHEMLGTAESRNTYERTLDALGDGSSQVSSHGKKARRPAEANNAYKMAEAYFKKKEMKQAEAHYRQAATFDAEDPKILTALAFCIWLNTDHEETQRTAEAKKRFTDIVTNFRYADAAYKLGLLLRKANDEAAAQRQFTLANKLDPAHTDAQREVRLAEMRHEKTKQEKQAEKGLFGKVFKK